MPKIEKKKKTRQEKLRDLENQKAILKQSMFKSSFITYLIAAIFLIISFLFNGLAINGWVDLVNEAALKVENNEGMPFIYIADILIKTISIIAFFFFTLISVANYRELSGYLMSWKELLVLLIITLIQATTSGLIFVICACGVAIVLTYMYFIQGKVNNELDTE
ncbi:hypothetical protein [Candidatus Lokiarchaeum ossiferum]|uniref:hypothetical protein n=1 Tax=Candidatus Lokiarchaeum ossiferum TaxID=2951803 RepID=UPI00352EF847